MPIKSTGCATCRKRKIRCDETRPGCTRCKTHGVTCPGYRTPAPGQVKFMDETDEVLMQYGGVKKKSRKPSADEDILTPISLDLPVSPSSSDTSVVATTGDADMDAFFLTPQESFLDFGRAMEMYAPPRYLASPAMEKSMIYSTFLDMYLPQRMGQQDAHFSFLQHLLTTPNLRPEVSASLDALSMVQVGSMYKDTGLLKSAVKSYSKALSALSRSIGRNDAMSDDYVLATVTMLATCEFFDEISMAGTGWTKHMEGSQNLLRARGPDSVQSQLALLLFMNMRHGALSHALINRKGIFLGTPEWRAVAFRVPVVDNSTLFYDTALQVPGVLERYDKLDFTSETLVEEIDSILVEARRLEVEMREWFESFRNALKMSGKATWRLVDVEQFSTFVGLCPDRTIDRGFLFPNFMVAYLVGVYWNVMHFMRATVQKLHTARHIAQKDWYPEPEEMVPEEELLEYVMNLCRCFPYYCEPFSSSTGQIGLFLPLRTAAVYFTERGHWNLLKWCGTVKNSCFNRGMHPPSLPEKFPKLPVMDGRSSRSSSGSPGVD